MSICYDKKEKITIKDTAALPAEIRESIAREIKRIRAFQEPPQTEWLHVYYNAGSGWEELKGPRLSRRGILSVLKRHRSVSLFFDFNEVWRWWKDEMETPLFFLVDQLKNSDSSLFDNLSFEFYAYADSSEHDFGIISQMYKKADGTVFFGEPEYDPIDDADVPAVTCGNTYSAVSVYAEHFTAPHDPESVKTAFTELQALDEFPEGNCQPYDFSNPDEQADINYPKLETAEQRQAFLDALDKLRAATDGEFFLGSTDELWLLNNEPNSISMLKLVYDYKTGEHQYYRSRPVPAL